MGTRDGQTIEFQKWWDAYIVEPYDPDRPEHKLLWELYDRGWTSGWNARADYDPRWDSD
jgi:hypothetical protein